jgi:hypothetical protein
VGCNWYGWSVAGVWCGYACKREFLDASAKRIGASCRRAATSNRNGPESAKQRRNQNTCIGVA